MRETGGGGLFQASRDPSFELRSLQLQVRSVAPDGHEARCPKDRAKGGRMLSAAQNDRLTQVGPETPMGELMRRYWHPFAAIAELDEAPIKPVRLLGENLVAFKTGDGHYGLVERQCPHRNADLANGM